MKKSLMTVIAFTSAFSYAELLPKQQNECPELGKVLSERVVDVVASQTQSSFSRAGNADINLGQEFAKTFSTNLFDVVEFKTCEPKLYQYQEKSCLKVDLSQALGRGNADFRGLYDLTKSVLVRSQNFAKLVKFNSSDASDVRLETAKKIVNGLVIIASQSEIPSDWEEFQNQLNLLVANNTITAPVADEIIKVNAENNQTTLGFKPMADVSIKEAASNEQFKQIFDLTKPESTRVKIIGSMFVGLEKADKVKLSRFFIEFASVNGIPESWDQVTLLLKEAVNKEILTKELSREVYRTNEEVNRKNTGFVATAEKCTIQTINDKVSVIETRTNRRFLKEVSQPVKVIVKNAPLLNNESEEITIGYAGTTSSTRIYVDSRFNSYTYTSNLVDGVLVYELTGSRVKVTPANTLAGQVVLVSGLYDLMLKNNGYNPKVDGKIIVTADFYETHFFLDRKLGSRVIEPKDGNLLRYLTQIKAQTPGRKIYAVVKMRYENSSFYNSNNSMQIRID